MATWDDVRHIAMALPEVSEREEVRQALEHALDRSHIIQVLGGPKINPPLTHVVPSGLVGSKDIDLYPHDTAKAKQMLQQAGVANMTLKFLYRPDSEGSRKSFQAAQQWATMSS